MMADCQEVAWGDDQDMQRLEEAVASEMPVPPRVPPASTSVEVGAAAAPPASAPASAAAVAEATDVCRELLDALSWSTDVKDESVLLVIAFFRERDAETPRQKEPPSPCIRIC